MYQENNKAYGWLASEYHVPSLPGLSEIDAKKINLFAGHIPINNSTINQLFFVLLGPSKRPIKDKLVSCFLQVCENLMLTLNRPFGLMAVKFYSIFFKKRKKNSL
jgi:hypothetical protein